MLCSVCRCFDSLQEQPPTLARFSPADPEIVVFTSYASVQQVKIANDGSMLAQQQVVAAVTNAHGEQGRRMKVRCAAEYSTYTRADYRRKWLAGGRATTLDLK